MLTLTEETGLLLYTHRPAAGGNPEEDLFSRTSGEVSLLAGAALMDLLLRGRLQVRLVSSGGRRLQVVLGVLAFLLVTAAFLWLPLQVQGSAIHLPAAAFVGTLLFLLIFVLAVGVAFRQVLRRNEDQASSGG